MPRIALAIFLFASVIHARVSVRCEDALVGQSWVQSLRVHGLVIGKAHYFLPRLPQLQSLLVPAARASDNHLFLNTPMTPEVSAALAELTTGMRRIADIVIPAMELPQDRRALTMRNAVFVRAYAGQLPNSSTDRWHQDGGDLQIIVCIEGKGTEFSVGPWWWPQRIRLEPGEFAIFIGDDLSKVTGIPAAWHRAPKNNPGRAAGFLRSPWLPREGRK